MFKYVLTDKILLDVCRINIVALERYNFFNNYLNYMRKSEINKKRAWWRTILTEYTRGIQKICKPTKQQRLLKISSKLTPKKLIWNSIKSDTVKNIVWFTIIGALVQLSPKYRIIFHFHLSASKNLSFINNYTLK